MDGIPKCQDTPIRDGSSEMLALLRPEPKPCLSLQEHVLQQLDVPRPDPEPKLSLKRTSEVYTSSDAIIHQDSPVHSTASGDVHCGFKCTSVHHDLEISVSVEDEICIPSPASLLDLKDIPSSLTAKAAVCCIDSSLAHASGMGYKHSTQHDIKSPPPDKVGLNSPPIISLGKLARVKSVSSPHNLCIRVDADEKEECLLCMGDRLLDEESIHEYMAVPLITQDSIDQSPNNAQSLSLSKGLVIPMSHDENAHHVDSHNPYRVPPPASKAKLSPAASHFLRTKSLLGRAVSYFLGNKSLLAMAADCMANNTSLA